MQYFESNAQFWSIDKRTYEVMEINDALRHFATGEADNITRKKTKKISREKDNTELIFHNNSFSQTILEFFHIKTNLLLEFIKVKK